MNLKNVPDLGWKLSTELNTKSKIIQIHEQIPQKDCIHIDLTQDNKKMLKLKFYLKRGGEVKGAWFKSFNFNKPTTNLLTNHQFQSPLSQYQNHQHLLEVVVC